MQPKMTTMLKGGELVEVLVGDTWKRARFVSGDSFWSPEMDDEIWWMDHFKLLDGFETVPDDMGRRDGEWPEWRYVGAA